ncbi:ribosome biogenesis GTP-binding protein YihA/YsxC [bacterium]|nr:ribosome biogenesis GTP-binding protein YihA/YsxC [bacterium]
MSHLKFVKSATKLSEFPFDHKPEVALAGRSNAGKSSLINVLARSRQSMAKVSQTPGKTALLNLFDHKEGYRVVDMPGYGYASRSGKEVASWRKMIESFLLGRENLKVLLLVMDIRRDWSDEEQMLLDLAERENLQFGLILSKADKLAKSAVKTKKDKLIQQLKVDLVLPFSNQTKEGLEILEKKLFDWLLA